MMRYFNQRTGNLRKCVRSEETCPQGALEAYFRTLEEPLGQRFAGDDVFYQRFLKSNSVPPMTVSIIARNPQADKKTQRRQVEGMNSIITVVISRRPTSMANERIHFPHVGTAA